MFDKFFKNNENVFYVIFRVIIGLMFLSHGLQKMFGLFSESGPMTGLMWIVGLFELLIGLAIAIGFFTRLAAFGGIILALIIYFKAHQINGLLPIINRGELILMYFAAYLMIIVKGAKRFSLEKLLLKKEIF